MLKAIRAHQNTAAKNPNWSIAPWKVHSGEEKSRTLSESENEIIGKRLESTPKPTSLGCT